MFQQTACAVATTFVLGLWLGTTAARADGPEGLALPAACASVGAAALQPLAAGPDAGFEATQFRVRLPPEAGAEPASMQAARLRVTGHGTDTPQAALEQAAGASAAALLIALTGNGHGGCPTKLLQATGEPIVSGLQHGGSFAAVWQDVVLRGHAGHVAAARMQLRLQAAQGADADRPVHVTLTLEHVTGKLDPPALLPDRISVGITLAASRLPALLAATGGGAPDEQIPVTVDEIELRRGTAVLHGRGDATAAATPLDSAASLQVTATGYDDLVTQAAVLGLTRVHAALFLSRLVAHRDGDGLRWDVRLADGVLAVNNVPIPLR